MVNQLPRRALLITIMTSMLVSLIMIGSVRSADGAAAPFKLKALFNVDAETGVYDAEKSFAFEVDQKDGFQTFKLPVSVLKTLVADSKLGSIAFVPAEASLNDDGEAVGGWPADKDAVYVDKINLGSTSIYSNQADKPFYFQNFASEEDLYYTYSINGIESKDCGVNDSKCVAFSVAGNAGTSWMIYKEPIDLAGLADSDKLTFQFDLSRVKYDNWEPDSAKKQPGVNEAPPATIEIGPGKTYENINDFAWETLKAGDVVYVYYRDTPYKEKIGIFAEGTKEQPIIIHGVPGPNGELPKIDGNGAVFRAQNPVPNANRSLVRIGKDSKPAKYVTFENFEVFNAHASKKYVNASGALASYGFNASGIWIDNGDHVTLRNNKIHDNGNGIFGTSSMYVWEGAVIDYTSKNLLIQGNFIYGNGNVGRMFEHNSYIAAIGTVYENNHYGDLLPGSQGYGLKDRGAGTVVRYNWIDGGRRQIALDDAEDSPRIVFDPTYNNSFVYANVLIERDHLFDTWGDDEIINFGGDNVTVPDRHGTLNFFNNTVVTYRQQRVYGQDGVPGLKDPGRTERTVLFYAPGKHVDARNNVFHQAGANPAPLVITDDDGSIELRNNWFTAGYFYDFNEPSRVPAKNMGTLTGTNPGWIDGSLGGQNYKLSAGSALINAGAGLPGQYDDLIEKQYVLHQNSEKRPDKDKIDIGAFEYGKNGGN
ncbi:right-handed parallel beta-helix repeat-containing protein [Paenibacillus sp. CF384]|uniref:right-handed parallel beta-helix repeat-containing protein n=1 Tax=Paenibacillus sp. CF384 TaxID=1884382 RepID=UPI00089A33FD|nr:right-handed parallel beta-helix repeat-containing protein [Paenibacillus sp. CF384]SDW17250.1 parallel beta-helix repeat (two copies) [Paenibacillus sp. CF384]